MVLDTLKQKMLYAVFFSENSNLEWNRPQIKAFPIAVMLFQG